MTTLAKACLAAALLLSTPALAEDAHHPASGTANSPAAEAAPRPSTTDAMPGGGATGMMGGDMMKMMNQMMAAGMMRGMMAADGMGMGEGGPMRQMMSPERVEGRIAFLRAELKVTAAQQPLWDAVASALRANSAASKGMMPAMTGGMMQPGASQPLPQRLSAMERMLSARLDGLRRLNAVLDPFYASLDATQKSIADDLLMPMGMM